MREGAFGPLLRVRGLVNQRRLRASALNYSGVTVTASVDDPLGGTLDFGTASFGEWFSLVVAIAGPIPEENAVELQCSATELRLTDSTRGITHVFTKLSEPVCGGTSCEARRGEA